MEGPGYISKKSEELVPNNENGEKIFFEDFSSFFSKNNYNKLSFFILRIGDQNSTFFRCMPDFNSLDLVELHQNQPLGALESQK